MTPQYSSMCSFYSHTSHCPINDNEMMIFFKRRIKKKRTVSGPSSQIAILTAIYCISTSQNDFLKLRSATLKRREAQGLAYFLIWFQFSTWITRTCMTSHRIRAVLKADLDSVAESLISSYSQMVPYCSVVLIILFILSLFV